MIGPRLKAGRCQCMACGLYFSGVREFDRHRAGSYAKKGEWQGQRYCRSLEQLLARGWRTDARGFLSQGRPERAPVVVAGHDGGGVVVTTTPTQSRAGT